MRKIIPICTVLIAALLSLPSCDSRVSQEEYDRVSNELSATQSELASLKTKLAEAEITQTQYEGLSAKYEELEKQYDVSMSEIEVMQIQYEGLSAKYEELEKQYDVIIEGTAIINEEDVEQAVFELVNQERKNNGLNELTWGVNLYKWAQANNRDMATSKSIQYSEYPSWQEVFWAAGYSTIDRIANATLITWTNNLYRYERNILNKSAIYGAVAAYKSGEIFYITYIAHVFR